MFPIFGDHREWNGCEIAFDHYLGVCSKFFSQLFFCSIPTIMTYTMLRFTGAFLYTIEGLSWQIFLINQRILQVSGDHPDYDKLKVGQNILWQSKIFHILVSCIKHHICIVTLFKKILGIVQSIFIIVMIAGVLAAIALVFFTLNVFENANTIMKLRLGALSISVITIIIVYCQTGQKISDRVYIFRTENYTGIRHFLIIFRWKESLTF
jgi:branched-subunit amino acid transport protein AzlD